MVIAVCIIVWILCDISQKSSRERRYYDEREERRHNELMEHKNKDWGNIEELMNCKDKKVRKIVREAMDEQGRFLRETIVEEE